MNTRHETSARRFPQYTAIIQTPKVKILKKPKFDITKLMELHADTGEDEGAALGRPENDEAKNTLTAEVQLHLPNEVFGFFGRPHSFLLKGLGAPGVEG